MPDTTTADSQKPLWAIDHPYYCQEGNYYKNGQHLTYASWTDFHQEWGDLDDDYNLVFRWDWQRPDPTDYEPYGEDVPPNTLQVFWVLQRKAILRSTECPVTEAEEPAIREWLTRKATHLRLVWEPLLDDQQPA
ncbi:hypothetical protein [Streptomyces sp. NPDC048338]|uniref:hypothetical protein n=1 Tax=Streptomyces sp. NPDC048338 TaxID=3365536 RepID=UPI00371935C1